MLTNKIHCTAVALSFFTTNFSVVLMGLSFSSSFLCPYEMTPLGVRVSLLFPCWEIEFWIINTSQIRAKVIQSPSTILSYDPLVYLVFPVPWVQTPPATDSGSTLKTLSLTLFLFFVHDSGIEVPLTQFLSELKMQMCCFIVCIKCLQEVLCQGTMLCMEKHRQVGVGEHNGLWINHLQSAVRVLCTTQACVWHEKN